MEWYQKSNEDLLQELNTDINNGISQDEANGRLEKYGPNELKEEARQSFLSKLLAQFKDVLVLILIAAAIVSAFVGEPVDAIVIIAIVIVNAILGLYQEGKAEKSLEALKKMSAPNAKIIRDGNQTVVPSNSVVPGDIVILETGDIIPADLRLVEASNLKIEEASLTGESVPDRKSTRLNSSH